MNYKKVLWYILAGMGILMAGFTGYQYKQRQDLQKCIADKVLRFHVIANSDENEDQELKLAVRDAVGAKMEEKLQGAFDKAECEKIVTASMEEIIETAQNVIADAGYEYEVDAFLAETEFPVKTYGEYTFPAGEYEALEVVIGSGSGHNWWCVMYPNMCFSGSVYEIVEDQAGESLKEVLSAEEYEEVLSSGNYEVRFKYLTFLNHLYEGNEE